MLLHLLSGILLVRVLEVVSLGGQGTTPTRTSQKFQQQGSNPDAFTLQLLGFLLLPLGKFNYPHPIHHTLI